MMKGHRDRESAKVHGATVSLDPTINACNFLQDNPPIVSNGIQVAPVRKSTKARLDVFGSDRFSGILQVLDNVQQ